jgi:molecular chaperone DnaJ
MQLKDYYKTLQVHPAATEAVIKKAFRRLALQYHPDKNPGNAIAEAVFKEIQEAYEVLSNPLMREEYNYKRWYNRSIGKNFSEKALTPAAILANCKKLNDYLAGANWFQLDYSSLNHYLHELISDETVALLSQYNHLSTNREIVLEVLKGAQPLPLTYASVIADKLRQFPGMDAAMQMKINDFIRLQKLRQRWKKYQLPVIVIVTLALCWFIFWLAKQ